MQGPIRCVPGFSTTYSSLLTARLERLAASAESHYREGYLQLLLGLSTLHDVVDAVVAEEPAQAGELASGIRQLHSSNDHLTALGEAMVRLRYGAFESADVDASDPLLAREACFARLDYEEPYRELAGQGAALPHRVFWDEVASRLRDGGARGGFRLLERHVRELQTDLRTLVAHTEACGRLAGRALGEALHDTAIPVARVMIGFTRLLTAFGYVSFLCERATRAHEAESEARPAMAV